MVVVDEDRGAQFIFQQVPNRYFAAHIFLKHMNESSVSLPEEYIIVER